MHDQQLGKLPVLGGPLLWETEVPTFPAGHRGSDSARMLITFYHSDSVEMNIDTLSIPGKNQTSKHFSPIPWFACCLFALHITLTSPIPQSTSHSITEISVFSEWKDDTVQIVSVSDPTQIFITKQRRHLKVANSGEPSMEKILDS